MQLGTDFHVATISWSHQVQTQIHVHIDGRDVKYVESSVKKSNSEKKIIQFNLK